MKKMLITLAFVSTLLAQNFIEAHCQMPCGIYHDDMVFEMIDQYLETMYKAMTELNHIDFKTSNKDKNQWIRWVLTKEHESDVAAELITKYFLQQKIKPGEEETAERLASAHKLLVQIVRIKQNVDVECVKSFADEWGKFKLMFHVEGYECQMEKKRLSQWEKVLHKAEITSPGTNDKAKSSEAVKETPKKP